MQIITLGLTLSKRAGYQNIVTISSVEAGRKGSGDGKLTGTLRPFNAAISYTILVRLFRITLVRSAGFGERFCDTGI